MSLAALPLFVKLAGRAVMLLGDGEAAEAKRRLLERAGAVIVGEESEARIAIVALDDPEPAVARLRARGILVNAVDRLDLCDFTLPAIIDRDPVLVAVGTAGASAGLAAALRQRIEALLPATLGELARALSLAKGRMRDRWPSFADRREVIGAALAEGGTLDPLREHQPEAVELWLAAAGDADRPRLLRFRLTSSDPEDLTLRQARALAAAERIFHRADVPAAILDRARADAIRIAGAAPPEPGPGLSIDLEIAR
jgi:uroporphyrin-III C-methyltransferase/precorrin-2 dehydrogenase/sirohydrochlorin ferrochelatase